MYRFTRAEADKLAEQGVVVIDTREKKCAHITKYFDEHKIPYVFEKLEFGDYTLKIDLPHHTRTVYLQNYCTIERKANLNELSANFTKGRERFQAEFARAKGHLYLLIEDATYKDIPNKKYQTEQKVKSFIGSLKAFEARYGIHTAYMDDKAYSGDFIYHTLFYHLRELLLEGEL